LFFFLEFVVIFFKNGRNGRPGGEGGAAVLNSEGKKNKNRYRPDSLILIS